MPPGNTGLRGMLDNIVTDGMRVAAEVKKQMQEAQYENNRPYARHDDEDDDEGDIDLGNDPSSAERRSVREDDRDLLEGADASAAPQGEEGDLMEMNPQEARAAIKDASAPPASEEGRKSLEKVVEFER